MPRRILSFLNMFASQLLAFAITVAHVVGVAVSEPTVASWRLIHRFQRDLSPTHALNVRRTTAAPQTGRLPETAFA